MDWTQLPRLEKTKERLENVTLLDGTIVENLDYGINLYKGAIKKDDCKKIIDDIENEIAKGIPGIQWSGAQVNKNQNVNDVRNCVDLKFKREHLGTALPDSKALFDAHLTVDQALDKCLQHYESLWHLKMQYKEAFNFVKYLPGKYFKIHGDHGPYYACTVSAVVYLNDDYDGGEIEFVRQGLVVKPEVGDIVMFPSNYVYEHASLEVRSGTKYSVVIMTDYNDLHHKVGHGYNG
jgi:predicted 2-oxoglutarate/Fe(II)-dependent dioxygenase YbiX